MDFMHFEIIPKRNSTGERDKELTKRADIIWSRMNASYILEPLRAF